MFVKCFYKYMVYELVREVKLVNIHGEKIKEKTEGGLSVGQ